MKNNVLTPITHYLFHLGDPKIQFLAELFCEVFENDPHFAEYRMCNKCLKMYGKEIVMQTGELNFTPCCEGLFIPIWRTSQVVIDLEKEVTDSGFVGYMVTTCDEVDGFCWGTIRERDELEEKFGVKLISEVFENNPKTKAFYLHEFGVRESKRRMGLGTRLLAKVLSDAKSKNPNLPVLLTTHINSSSIGLYSKFGLKLIGSRQDKLDRVVYAINPIESIKI